MSLREDSGRSGQNYGLNMSGNRFASITHPSIYIYIHIYLYIYILYYIYIYTNVYIYIHIYN